MFTFNGTFNDLIRTIFYCNGCRSSSNMAVNQ